MSRRASTWELPTATGRYRLGFTEVAGPYLSSWGPDDPPDAEPTSPSAAFRTEPDRFSAELSALGTRQTRAADLIVDHGDGLLGARLLWRADRVRVTEDGPRTRLQAVADDTAGGLRLTLVIETSRDGDVVTKHAVIDNLGDRACALRRAFAPAWELPIGPGAMVDVLAGDWSREFTPYRVSVPVGEFSIGSRQGITSHRYSPVITVAAPGRLTCYGFALAWSGSWRMSVEAEPFDDRVRVAGGVDDESGSIALEPGESYRTPDVLGICSPDGRDALARRWHDHQRRRLARDPGPRHRPIVYNSWYATTFDVRVEYQLALAGVAADLGVECFVIDDGWFRGRTSDRAGLGDWTPDPVKFPDGLTPLAAAVREQGMRFGVWVEPEAVNPDSDLYRAHPDWVYRAGDRPLLTVRNQYVLDLGRPEVIGWTEQWLRSLLTAAPIGYLKWDMNRPVSDGGRPGDSHGGQWSVQHTEGYYAVLAMLRREFPDVTVEACAGGGGRIDAAVLGLTDVVWPSDETGPRDRLAIQFGFLSAYAPHLMSSWVTDQPSRSDPEPVSLEFRFVVAMAGVLGIGSDLLRWSGSELHRATGLVRLYRQIRSTVLGGRVQRHGHPSGPFCAVEYATDDQMVILVWARSSRPETVRIVPSGLDPAGRYRIRGRSPIRTGTELAAGIVVAFDLAEDTDVIILDRLR